MTVSFYDMANKEGLYSFVGDDGQNVHVAIERLYKWVQDFKYQLETFIVPVHPQLGKRFIQENLVRRERVRTMTPRECAEPIIFGKEKRGAVSKIDMYLLDGRHRYVRAVALGNPCISAFILEPKQWLAFQVTDIPDITKEQLDRMPVRPMRGQN